MAENSRRVNIDEQGKITGGLKPMPEGTARVKTKEDLEAMARNQADLDAAAARRADRQYQSALNLYKQGINAGFGFKPRPEDAKEAMDLRGAAVGRRDKFLGDEERFDEANNPKGFKKGGKVSSASKRADGIAQRGKTKGRML